MKYHEAYEAHLRGEKVEMLDEYGSWRSTSWSSALKYYVDKEFRLALKKLTVDTPWKNSWAKWRAVDPNGELWEYDHKPKNVKTRWFSIGECSGKGYDAKNWQQSIQERPRKKRPMTTYELAGKWLQSSTGTWYQVVIVDGSNLYFADGTVLSLSSIIQHQWPWKWADQPSAEVHDSFEVDDL